MIVFENDGLIDPMAITTMGLNAKVGENPVGFFGTGLKYAIAILLRTGHDIRIFRGKDEFVFTTQPHESRGKKFDIVAMNGQPIGFTTDLGKKWELWQALRELWCNCTDEGGAAFAAHFYNAREGRTTVTVQGSEFAKVFEEREKYILTSEPVVTLKGVNLHKRLGHTVFYRGVAVGVLPENKSPQHTYNITGYLDLTEDRTFKYLWQVEQRIAEALQTADDVDLIKKAVSAPAGTLERSIDHTFMGETPTPAYIAAVESARHDCGDDMNETAIKHVLKHAPPPAPVEFKPTPTEAEQLEAATTFLRGLDIDLTGIGFRFVEVLGTGSYGASADGSITLSRSAFIAGTKQLAATILEEHVALTAGVSHETRAMQDALVEKIVALGEKHVLGRSL